MVASTKIITWKNVKSRVSELNMPLFNLIEEINPKDLPIFLVKYPYGTTISTDRHYFIPDAKGELKPFDIDKFPYMFVLEKALELYADEKEKNITRQIYTPGSFFPYNFNSSRTGAMSPRPKSVFTLCSGVRNINILPIFKMNDHYKQLSKHFTIDKKLNPGNPDDHFNIALQILKQQKSDWHSSVLVFSDEWTKNINDNPKWLKLKCHLLEQCINKNAYSKNQFLLDHAIHDIIRDNNLKLTSYSIEIIKQMIYIALGDYPGFKPSTDDNALPRSTLVELLNNFYLNTPIIIEPTIQPPKYGNPPIYHALMLSASINRTSLKSSQRLFEIAENFDAILQELSTHLLTQTAAYGKLNNCLEYRLYSERGGNHKIIKDSLQLLQHDYRFKYRHANEKENVDEIIKSFPRRSLFAKALISLSYNNNLVPVSNT
ncbi:MAG: hypothetical protein P1U40_11305 [Coxiellaceae bacterium]|nr:hypothetical protein [Coxiellaceae bacterium]